jgi:hypothetical protein
MRVEHLDDGMLQTILHDEAGEARAVELRAHLDACAECRDRVAVARREEADLFKSLEVLDVPAPGAKISDLRTRATDLPRGGAGRVAWRWAAGILLVVGLSGIAYAAPGSPLRSILARLAGWIRPPSPTPVREPDTPTPPVAGGVLLDPGDGVVIEARSLQPFDSLVVFLVDEQQISVRSHGGAVTFVSDVARLSISNASGAARIEVAIPRGAPRVEIVSAGRRLYLKVGNAVTSVATDTTGGRHVIVPPSR